MNLFYFWPRGVWVRREPLEKKKKKHFPFTCSSTPGDLVCCSNLILKGKSWRNGPSALQTETPKDIISFIISICNVQASLPSAIPSYLQSSLTFRFISNQLSYFFYAFCFSENALIFVYNTQMPLSNSLGLNDKFNPLEKKLNKKVQISH